jgi:uncharacterized protein (TIGR03437 family)
MTRRRAHVFLWLCLMWAALAPGQTAIPELGEPPAVDLSLPAPEATRFREQVAQNGAWIDVFNREAVRVSYNNLLATATNIAMGWTGSVAAGSAGTTDAAYKAAVLAHLNWYRGMAGVPPLVGWDAALEPEQQQAALMMSANRRTSHMPDMGWPQYTEAGARAAGASNLCIMFKTASNPGCVNTYMWDFGVSNTAVGHRRWIVHPQTQRLATGDADAADTYPTANALRAYDGNLRGTRPPTREEYVAWPPNGFVPYQAMPNRWSFGFPAANFQGATVTLQRRGASVPVAVEPLATGFGENTIVFVPDGLPPGDVPNPARPAGDLATTVSIRNVMVGSQRRDFTYTVIVFDPASAGPVLGPPLVTSNESVVHGATLRSADPLAPNGFGTVYGTNLASSTRSWDQSFENGRAPTDLGGTLVLVNGKPGFISFTARGADFGVGFDQINFIAPEDDAEGPVQLVVVTPQGRSQPRLVTLSRRSPAFFPFDPRGRRYIAAIENSGRYLVGPSDLFGGPVGGRPVQGAIPNDALQFFATAMGGTDPPVAVGQIPSGISKLVDTVRVVVGNLDAEVFFAGLSPFAGVYQIVIRTPNLPPGEYPIYAEIAGRRTQDGLLLVIGRAP